MAVKSSKIALQVETRSTPDGWAMPLVLKYNDESFPINNPIHSVKLINGAVRWRCSIDGRQMELFNEGERWWIIQ